MDDFIWNPTFWIGLVSAYFTFFVFPICAVLIVAYWRIFSKAEQPGWAILIPFYNLYVYTQIIKRPGWWMLLYLLGAVPFIGALGVAFLFLIDSLRLAKVFGRSTEFGVGLFFLNIIFICILAFGKSEYEPFHAIDGELI
ncbi:MAG TPA: signal peptidase I [Opitutae bacterium]|nr:signal peptidase I [Opitutae bacterium]